MNADMSIFYKNANTSKHPIIWIVNNNDDNDDDYDDINIGINNLLICKIQLGYINHHEVSSI